MKDGSFIDANIWGYAHLDAAGSKCAQALHLLENLPVLVSSTQVLIEYYSVMLKKKVADPLIQDNIEAIVGVSDIQAITLNTLRDTMNRDAGAPDRTFPRWSVGTIRIVHQ